MRPIKAKIIILTALLCCVVFGQEENTAAVQALPGEGQSRAGLRIYGYFSPSIPVTDDWFNYVESYPALEGGLAMEIPSNTVFWLRLEGCYTALPSGGALQSGDAIWVGAGPLVRRKISDACEISVGPQFTYGRVAAKGAVILEEGDTSRYRIEFDDNGSGIGISIVGGFDARVNSFLRLGAHIAVVYFGIKNEQTKIVGYDLDNPEDPVENGTYNYLGEYATVSLRLVIGFEPSGL